MTDFVSGDATRRDPVAEEGQEFGEGPDTVPEQAGERFEMQTVDSRGIVGDTGRVAPERPDRDPRVESGRLYWTPQQASGHEEG